MPSHHSHAAVRNQPKHVAVDDQLIGRDYKKGKFSKEEDQQLEAAIEKFRIVWNIFILLVPTC